MTNDRFASLFGEPARSPDQLLTRFHMDVAASIQAVLDEVVLRLTRSLARQTGSRNLCLAGGVALNCVANGKILRDGRFENIWIQPAAGDAGGAWARRWRPTIMLQGPAAPDRGRRWHVGLAISARASARRNRTAADGGRRQISPCCSDAELIESTAEALGERKAVGWFQGRMEFGPRALGARSILGDPRSPAMQKTLNLKVKYRESFRPFAPAVLREDVAEWFELDCDSPYMLLVADVRQDKRRAHDARRTGAVRHRQAQCAALAKFRR